MANPEHVETVLQRERLYKWLADNPDETLNLRRADLRRADLRATNLTAADLSESNLTHTKLDETNFAAPISPTRYGQMISSACRVSAASYRLRSSFFRLHPPTVVAAALETFSRAIRIPPTTVPFRISFTSTAWTATGGLLKNRKSE